MEVLSAHPRHDASRRMHKMVALRSHTVVAGGVVHGGVQRPVGGGTRTDPRADASRRVHKVVALRWSAKTFRIIQPVLELERNASSSGKTHFESKGRDRNKLRRDNREGGTAEEQ